MVLPNDWRQVGNNGGGCGMRAVGCIKSTKGPWVVHRKTKDGGVKKTLRFPSDRERVENKERERRRRAVSSKIFAGLRAHGNYRLSTKSDSNDVLKAVCDEAGWIVADDGTVLGRRPKTPGVELGLAAKAGLEENQEGYRTCPCNGGNLQASNEIGGSETLRMVPHFDESDLTLSLSLPIRPASNPLGFNRSLRMMPHFDESDLTLSLPIRPASNLLGFNRTFMQR